MAQTTFTVDDAESLAGKLDAICGDLEESEAALLHALFAGFGQAAAAGDAEVSGFTAGGMETRTIIVVCDQLPAVQNNLFESFQWGVGRGSAPVFQPAAPGA
jgi:hypothetical protein